jgi:hypothetical protein
MIEATGTSERLVTIYHITTRHFPAVSANITSNCSDSTHDTSADKDNSDETEAADDNDSGDTGHRETG